MNVVKKLEQIVEIQKNQSVKKIGDFDKPINEQEIRQIETLLGEPLTDEFKQLYYFANGQLENGVGLLFGEWFLSSSEIIKQLEFSVSLVKPDNKTIEDKEQSEKLLEKIVSFYIDKAPKEPWYKIEFSCGLNSFGGPYIYENSNERERKIFKIDFSDYKIIQEVIKKLHELEKATYNWDELQFVAYADSHFECNRTFYDFDNQITFTSTPENAIKKKYFHFKWLPIFSDCGGNYIGIDFDPDISGTKGQIINFGRDEENMLVLSNNLEDFFDFILTEIKKPKSKILKSKNHLHDILKKLKA